MTNDDLNRYIKHYIEKDKTDRAIMLDSLNRYETISM